MARWDTIAIVGVGLIGGSIGLALRRRGAARHVVGIGRRMSSLRKAQQLQAVSAITIDIAEGVRDAELIVVCTPIADIVPRVTEIAAHCAPSALITDVGSTKAQVVAALDGRLDRDVLFIGSHPMAGSDRSGAQNAQANLFDGRVTVVTPTPRTPTSATERLIGFWETLGSTVLQMAPAVHDQIVASTSHATHVIASVLAAATERDDLALAATGWADTTRIAAADPQLWLQILMSNRAAVLRSLDKFETLLSAFRAALDQADEARILQLLEMGKQTRDALGS